MRGELYVQCKGGCLPLPLEGLGLTPVSEIVDQVLDDIAEGTSKGGRGKGTQEGGDAAVSDDVDTDLPW